jgi:uncharacterized protein (TIGR03083 family)
MGDPSVDEWLQPTFDEVRASTERFLVTAARLTDAEVKAPSGLPGWTRGHVLAHLARNADGLTNLMIWARTGVETRQYESAQQRDGDIATGAPRNAAEQLADNEAAAGRLEDELASAPTESLETMVVSFAGWSHPGWYTLYRRWREVEAHHVDLDAGYSPADWPASYVRWDLTESAGGLALSRLRATDLDLDLAPSTSGPSVEGPARELLAWVAGRTNGAVLTADGALPPLPNWPGKPPADWRTS